MREFIAEQIRTTSKGNAHKHYRVLRLFFNWLIAQKERTTASPVDPDDEPKPPKNPKQPLTDDEIRALLATCASINGSLRLPTCIGVTARGAADLVFQRGPHQCSGGGSGRSGRMFAMS
jgi:integrase